MCLTKDKQVPRVRVLKIESHYYSMLGGIIGSNCDGTFRVQIWIEGNPVIDLKPNEVDPC